MKAKIGDKICYLDTTGSGEVTAILSNGMILVTDSDSGIKIPVPESQIVVLNHSDEIEQTVNIISKNDEQKKETKHRDNIPTESVGRNKIEVDLHLSAKEQKQCLKGYPCLDVQLDKCKRILQKYKDQKGWKIVFIHGKGDGTLRAKVRQLVKFSYPSYLIGDAHFGIYGMYGATEVQIC